MWEKFRVVWAIPELRQKILLTLLLLAIYRVGWQITLPVVDPAVMRRAAEQNDQSGMGGLLRSLAVFSASQLQQATIFGLGIMPYISASIIFQLLASVIPALEKLQKEGESGRKKINEYTRYATVVICLVQSYFYLQSLLPDPRAGVNQDKMIRGEFLGDGLHMPFFVQLVTVLMMTAGALFLMWLGEQIDEFGIGNGISLLIMAGILADMPGALNKLFDPIMREGLQLGGSSEALGVEYLILMVVLFLAIVTGVVFITLGQRRIPTQSAKHVRGRKVFGGTRNYLPLRVNQSGVMPIIFASSLLLFPHWIFVQLATREANQASSAATASNTGSNTGKEAQKSAESATADGQDEAKKQPPKSAESRPFPFWANFADAFQRGTSYWYNVLYVALIFFFCYFWTAITFNPNEMANNLKDFGTFIPGYRPGKRTAEFLEKVMLRITYVGAAFLAVVAVIPTVVSRLLDIDPVVAQFFGGTGLLIAVSVAFDLVQKIDSHLVMRNYKGLLERT